MHRRLIIVIGSLPSNQKLYVFEGGEPQLRHLESVKGEIDSRASFCALCCFFEFSKKTNFLFVRVIICLFVFIKARALPQAFFLLLLICFPNYVQKYVNAQKDVQGSMSPLRVPNGGVAAQLLRKHIVFDVLVFAENWKKIKMHRKMRTSRFPPYGFEMAELRLNAFENI